MIMKTYILDESGKFLTRKIKTEGGREYILHRGMKAFLKDLPTQQYGEYTVIQKQVDYYIDKGKSNEKEI